MEKFSYEENGYNRKEVNHFIGEVIENTEAIGRYNQRVNYVLQGDFIVFTLYNYGSVKPYQPPQEHLPLLV